MSTVDTRITEMRFDNKDFEKNIKTSMSSLDKLKSKLDLTDSARGLTKVESATTNVQAAMQAMGNGVEKAGESFGTLVKKALVISTVQTIVDDLTGSVKNLANQFSTLASAKSGFSEYELKMDSVKTIMNSTGKTVEEVTEVLDELNEYADKTIYSFSDMTSNVGKFTNVGVELDDAVSAIEGISNVAALAGANSDQASRAMYNLAQALGTGYVRITDWASVETATLNTKTFEEELIKVAYEMGELTQETDGTYKTLNGTTVSVENFRSTLSDAWLTSKVLIRTLGNFSDEETELGQKAYNAATEITTFSKLVDTLKESLGSGWATTWEKFIGNFEVSKALFTQVGNYLSNIVKTTSDARNQLIQGWVDLGGREDVIEGIKNIWNGILSIVKPIKEAFADVFPPTTAETLKVISSKFLDISERLYLSEDAASGLRKGVAALLRVVKASLNVVKAIIKPITNVIKKIFTVNDATEETTSFISKLLTKFGILGDTVTTFLATNDISGYFSKAGEKIAGFIAKVVNVTKTVATTIRDFIISIKSMSGEDIKEAAVNLFTNFISKVKEKASEAKDVLFGVGENIVEGLKEGLTSKINTIKEKASEIFHSFIDKIKELFGIQSPSKVMIDVASDVSSGFTSGLAEKWDELKQAASDFVKTFWDKLTEKFDKFNIKEKATNIVVGFKNGIKKGFKTIKDSAKKFVQKFVDKFKELFGIHSPSTIMYEAAINVTTGFTDGITDQLSKIKESASEFVSAFIEKIKEIPQKVKSIFDKSGDELEQSKFGTFLTKLWEGIKDAANAVWQVLQGLFDFLKNNLKSMSLEDVLNVLKTIGQVKLSFSLSGFLDNFGDSFSTVGDSIGDFFKQLKDKLGSSKDNVGVVDIIVEIANAILKLSIAMLLLTTIPEDRLASIGGTLAGILAGLFLEIFGIMKMSKGLTDMTVMAIVVKLISQIALACIELSIAVKILGKMDAEDMWQGLEGVAIVFLLIGALVVILEKYSAKYVAGLASLAAAGTFILSLSGAVRIIASAVKLMGKMKTEDMWQGLSGLAIIFILLGLLVFEIIKLSTSATLAVGSLALTETLLLAISELIFVMAVVVKMLGKMDPADMWQGVAAVAVLMILVGLFLLAVQLICKIKSTSLAISIGILLSMSLLLISMAVVVKMLSSLSDGRLTKGIIALGLMIGMISLLVLVLAAISVLTGGVGLGLIAILILALAASLLIMAKALVELSAIPGGRIILMLLELAGGLLVLGLVSSVLALLSPVILILALALLALGAAISLIGSGIYDLAQGFDILANYTKEDAQIVGENIGTTLVTAIHTFVTEIKEMIPEIVALGLGVIWAVLEGINKEIGGIVAEIVLIVAAIIEGLAAGIGPLIVAIYDFVYALMSGFVDAYSTYADKFTDLFWEAINAFLDHAIYALDKAKDEVEKLCDKFAELIIKTFELMKDVPKQIGRTILSLILSNMFGVDYKEMKKKVNGLFDKLSRAWDNLKESVKELGKNIINGIFNGFDDFSITDILNKVKGVGEDIVGAFKEFFGIKSPSRLMRDEVGKYITEGLGDGIEKYSSYATKAAEMVGEETTESLQNGLKVDGMDLGSIISTDPVIRPVLDLSDIISGANSIGGILGNHSVALAADVSASGASSNSGGISINMEIYGAEGQDVTELANKVADKINDSILKKGRAW